MSNLNNLCTQMYEQAKQVYNAIKKEVSEQPNQMVFIDNDDERIEITYFNVGWREADSGEIYGIRVNDDELEVCFNFELIYNRKVDEEYWFSLQDCYNVCFVQSVFDIADKLDVYLDSSGKPL